MLQSPVAPAVLVLRPSQPCPRLLVKLQRNVHHKEIKQTNKGNMHEGVPIRKQCSGRAQCHVEYGNRGIPDAEFEHVYLIFIFFPELNPVNFNRLT